MTDLPTPEASRLRAPSWRDSRLIIGVLLVLSSTVLGSVVVARADDRVPVYTVTARVAPGEKLDDDDVSVVDVQLGDLSTRYLAADRPVPAEAWVLRELRPGELVPVDAIGDAGEVDVQPVALRVDATSAAALGVGALVDVYVNRPTKASTPGTPAFAGPVLVLPRVSVVSVATEDAVLGGAGETRAVTVGVPRDSVKGLVADVDAGARMTLVPVPGGQGGGS
ncbi:MAG: hypothetical protein ACRCY8_17830 [Dermatophilaceae bacterium]